MNFKNFSSAQFLKLRNGITSVGEFRYDTICRRNFVLIGKLVWRWLGGTKILHMHTYKHTHIHTDIHTDTCTHTHTYTHTHPEAYFISLVSLQKCRNKAKIVS